MIRLHTRLVKRLFRMVLLVAIAVEPVGPLLSLVQSDSKLATNPAVVTTVAASATVGATVAATVEAATFTIGPGAMGPALLTVEVGQEVLFHNTDTRTRRIIIAGEPVTGTLDPAPTATVTSEPQPSPTVTPTVTPSPQPSPTVTAEPEPTATPQPTAREVYLPTIHKRAAAHTSAQAHSSAATSRVRPAENSGLFLPAIADDPAVRAVAWNEIDGAQEIELGAGAQTARTFTQAGSIAVVDGEDGANTALILVTTSLPQQEGTVTGRIIDYATKGPISGARVRAVGTDFEAETNPQGDYALPLPSGTYTLALFANGYTFANRIVAVTPFMPVAVATVELVALDETVTPIDSDGGTAANSADSTNVAFANSAVDSTKAVRLTVLEVNEFTADFAALPGSFTDGRIPLGFVSFEPDGTNFDADAVWTIDYDGNLPVGTYVPCFYWIEEEARWGEPVDGEVVDLGNGKKGLRATLPHFSSYGFAAAPPPEPAPPAVPDEDRPDTDDPLQADNNPNEDTQDQCLGSQINFMSGELCQTVGTAPLPSVGGLPMQVMAKYNSRKIFAPAEIDTEITFPTGAATPATVGWSAQIGGQSFGGSNSQISVSWDGTTAAGTQAPPGVHRARVTLRASYSTSSGGGGANSQGVILPAQPCTSNTCGQSNYETTYDWPMLALRNDLSPFGLGWFGPYDTLLVDNGDLVTIFEGVGRYIVFERQPNGAYEAPKGDFSTLVHNNDGSWTRTFQNGDMLQFSDAGRLERIQDRYGNFQTLTYESNGRTLAPGEWGLTTRIQQIADSSGNTFDFAYDANGWLEAITDSANRVYAYEHDDAGHLTAAIDPLGRRQRYAYDERHMMTSYTDPDGNVTTYVLDDRGRLLSRTWPTGTTLEAAYAEQRVEVTLDNGALVHTTLDEDFNPIVQYNGVYSVTWSYNEDNLPTGSDKPYTAVLYDDQGNIIESTGQIRTLYEYAGPFSKITRATSAAGFDTRFEYDAHGNLTRLTDVLGRVYTFTYDDKGQPLSVTDPLGHTTSFAYTPRGQVAEVTDALGETVNMTYDEAGNLTQITDSLGRQSTMTYDDLNRLATFVDALGGQTELAYDAAPRGFSLLTSVTDASDRVLRYEYDVLGRMTKTIYADGSEDTFTYDAAGNLIAYEDERGARIEWTYDAANRPVRQVVQGESETNLVYDELDQVTRTVTALDGGANLDSTVSYLAGTRGYPYHELQIASGLPLTVETDYAYGGLDFLTSLGLEPVAAPAPTNSQQTELQAAATLSNTNGAPRACSETLSSVITQTRTLTRTTGAYCFGVGGNNASETFIEPGVTLTVAAGVQLVGRGAAALIVSGTVVLSGTTDSPAILTAESGVPPGLSNYGVVVPDEGRIVFHQAEMWYSGRCNISFCESQLLLQDNATGLVVESHLGLGSRLRTVRVEGNASLDIRHSILGDPDTVNDRGMLHVNSTGRLSVTESTILHMTHTATEPKGVWVNAPRVAGVLNGSNVFSSTTGRLGYIFVTGSVADALTEDTTWLGLDQAPGLRGLYFVFEPLHVRNNATLAIEGPMYIRVHAGWQMGAGGSEGGHLEIRGRPEAPVTLADPSNVFGGFHVLNSNASLTALYTDFDGAVVDLISASGGTVDLQKSSLRNAERNFDRRPNGISVSDGGTAQILDSVISNNGGYGAFVVSGASVVISNTAIVGNQSGGILQTRDSTVTARHNFWGAANGPFNESTNPNGKGQSVSDGVDFLPWQPTPGNGRLTGLRVTSNANPAQTLLWEFDAMGQGTSLTSQGYGVYTLGYEHDAAGRMTLRRAETGHPFSTTYTYDDVNRLTSMRMTTAGNIELLALTYEYDAANNIVAIDSSRDGRIDYTYDALDRLTNASGAGLAASYGYDAAGNRTSADGVTASYDNGGRLTSRSDGATYTYDADGNLATKTVGGETTSYTWDVEGRLARIDYQNGTFSAYQYDVAGRRISKRSPDGTLRYYVYAGDLLLQELDETGAVVAAYTYDGLDRPVSLWREGEIYYYLNDHLGSVLGLLDSSGTMTRTYRYDPWGNVITQTGALENALRFTGREFDEESGLYYLRARYYDPTDGRFISRDPTGTGGGLNLYAYVANNPIRYTDPYGYALWAVGRDALRELAETGMTAAARVRSREQAAALLREGWDLVRAGAPDNVSVAADDVGRALVPVQRTSDEGFDVIQFCRPSRRTNRQNDGGRAGVRARNTGQVVLGNNILIDELAALGIDGAILRTLGSVLAVAYVGSEANGEFDMSDVFDIAMDNGIKGLVNQGIAAASLISNVID